AVAQGADMDGRCRRCGVRGNLLNRLNPHGLCKKCARETAEGLARFRTRFLAASADGVMELREWQDLQAALQRDGLDAAEALTYVRTDALNLLERTLALARADGIITPQEEEEFERLAALLEVPAGLVEPLRREMERLKAAAQLREGHLPTIQSTIILDAGEVAHLECRASFRHVTATRTRDIPGRLVVTSQKVHFISDREGGWNVQYGKVLRVQELPGGVNLELGVKKGSGLYSTDDALILAATLDALVRIHKRLLLMPQTERASRSIPHKLKLEVWQRDGGKCVECSDNNYLEFDHVIPHSLGGATSASNLQLLCRRCNLAKSNRL
ncbi:MAG: HNH endonuclease, partial [Deinococcus sp.]|nr:HNH endonuclease [Deinococcus sp.]